MAQNPAEGEGPGGGGGGGDEEAPAQPESPTLAVRVPRYHQVFNPMFDIGCVF